MKRGRKPGSLSRFTCSHCGVGEFVLGGSRHFLCTQCKADGVFPSKIRTSDKDFAGQRVAAAIKKGELRRPNEFDCVDCGKPAQQYDHRDYNFPLKVEPVCRSCNLKRGPAIPRVGHIEKKLSLGFVPYRLKFRVHQLFTRLGRDTQCLADLPAVLTLSHWKAIWPEFVDVPHTRRSTDKDPQ